MGFKFMWVAARTLFFLITLGIIAMHAADLRDVRSVYAWPMTKSFDQYLAQKITGENVFDVVVDPKLADAIFTDRIDAPFLAAMDEIFPLNQDQERDVPDAQNKDAESIESGSTTTRPKNRALSRPRGTLFLVDVSSRKVLWSTYLREYEETPDKLSKMASIVVERITSGVDLSH